VLLGAAVLLAVAVADYGLIRWLRPDRDPSRGVVEGTLHDLERVFLHFDFGACIVPGCPSTAYFGARWRSSGSSSQRRSRPRASG